MNLTELVWTMRQISTLQNCRKHTLKWMNTPYTHKHIYILKCEKYLCLDLAMLYEYVFMRIPVDTKSKTLRIKRYYRWIAEWTTPHHSRNPYYHMPIQHITSRNEPISNQYNLGMPTKNGTSHIRYQTNEWKYEKLQANKKLLQGRKNLVTVDSPVQAK